MASKKIVDLANKLANDGFARKPLPRPPVPVPASPTNPVTNIFQQKKPLTSPEQLERAKKILEEKKKKEEERQKEIMNLPDAQREVTLEDERKRLELLQKEKARKEREYKEKLDRENRERAMRERGVLPPELKSEEKPVSAPEAVLPSEESKQLSSFEEEKKSIVERVKALRAESPRSDASKEEEKKLRERFKFVESRIRELLAKQELSPVGTSKGPAIVTEIDTETEVAPEEQLVKILREVLQENDEKISKLRRESAGARVGPELQKLMEQRREIMVQLENALKAKSAPKADAEAEFKDVSGRLSALVERMLSEYGSMDPIHGLSKDFAELRKELVRRGKRISPGFDALLSKYKELSKQVSSLREKENRTDREEATVSKHGKQPEYESIDAFIQFLNENGLDVYTANQFQKLLHNLKDSFDMNALRKALSDSGKFYVNYSKLNAGTYPPGILARAAELAKTTPQALKAFLARFEPEDMPLSAEGLAEAFQAA